MQMDLLHLQIHYLAMNCSVSTNNFTEAIFKQIKL